MKRTIQKAKVISEKMQVLFRKKDDTKEDEEEEEWVEDKKEERREEKQIQSLGLEEEKNKKEEEEEGKERGEQGLLPSSKSIYNFILINSFLFLVAACEYFLSNAFSYSFLPLLLIQIAKNVFLTYCVEKQVASKPFIDAEKRVVPEETFRGEFFLNLCIASSIETITKSLCHILYSFSPYSPLSSFDTLFACFMFIPFSFFFELVFDFFHYWSHRLLHQSPSLYRNIHKKHHKFAYPIPIIAFYQDTIDLLLTNLFPTILALALLPSPSAQLLTLVFTFKTYIEICGHSGKEVSKTPAFVQFIWLPKAFGIELYTVDHDRHHSLNNCNYSKRFSLWDKVFGTFHE